MFYEVDENYEHYRWARFTVTGGGPSPIVMWMVGFVAISTWFLVVNRRTKVRQTPFEIE